MQTLGLGGPEERSESRLESLFWPAVKSDIDVNYLTSRGFWLCFILAVITLASSLFSGAYAGVFDAVFFWLGGTGVRQRSRVAAVSVFAVYFLVTVNILRFGVAAGGSGSVVRVFACALLFANVRAVWIASNWRKSGKADESPTRFESSLADKISDWIPSRMWPRLKILFYAFAVLEIGGMVAILSNRFRSEL